MKTMAQDPTVRHRFSAAAASYDRHADAQRQAADHLVTCLPAGHGVSTILEAGCGTGYFTRSLATRFPDAAINALDLSPGMVAAARAACPTPERVQWHISDLAHFQTEEPYDLLASNAALHWIHPRDAAFAAAGRLLRPGGTFACSLMVRGTLRELHETRIHCAPHKPPRQPLPTPDELQAALGEHHFRQEHMETRSFRSRHRSALDFLVALHDMGLTGGPFSRAATPLNRSELRQVADTYQQRFGAANGEVFATYQVTFIRAIRQS